MPRLPSGKLNLSCEKLIHSLPRGEDGFTPEPPPWPPTGPPSSSFALPLSAGAPPPVSTACRAIPSATTPSSQVISSRFDDVARVPWFVKFRALR